MTKDKATKQGTFIEELKSRQPNLERRKRIYWGEEFASAKEDTAAPKVELQKVPSKTAEAKSKKSQPKPTADLPKTINGTIDLEQMKSDLVSELRAHRKRG